MEAAARTHTPRWVRSVRWQQHQRRESLRLPLLRCRREPRHPPLLRCSERRSRGQSPGCCNILRRFTLQAGSAAAWVRCILRRYTKQAGPKQRGRRVPSATERGPVSNTNPENLTSGIVMPRSNPRVAAAAALHQPQSASIFAALAILSTVDVPSPCAHACMHIDGGCPPAPPMLRTQLCLPTSCWRSAATGLAPQCSGECIIGSVAFPHFLPPPLMSGCRP